MNFTEFKEVVIREAEKAGIAEYELYYQVCESTSVSAFQHATNQLENPQRIVAVKKDIARVNTILRELELRESK